MSLPYFLYYRFFVGGFVGPWALYCLILIGDFILEGILNVLPCLSLFTLVFICIFSAWLMGACDFCLRCSSLMGDKFFSLSSVLFGGRIGDLCNGYFVGYFALLGVIHVGVVDPMCVFVWTITLDLFLFPTCCWDGAWSNSAKCSFSGVPKTLANHSLSTGSIYPWVLYICHLDWLYPPSVKQRHSCFLPCSSLQFSWLPGGTYSTCFTSSISFSFFCKGCKILCKTDNLVASLHISFPSSNLPWCGLGPFHHIWHISVVLYRLPSGVHIFGNWSTSGALERTVQLSQDNRQSSPPWEYGAD